MVGCKLELLDVLVNGLLVDYNLISVDYVTFCLMTEHPFNRGDVELASRFGDDLCDLGICAAWLQQP